jgi:hypothetical protein
MPERVERGKVRTAGGLHLLVERAPRTPDPDR